MRPALALSTKRADDKNVSAKSDAENRGPAADISQPGVYLEQLKLAYVAAGFLCAMPLDEMVEALSLTEQTAPISHPMLFLAKSSDMRQDKQILEILAFAKRKLMKLEGGDGR